MDDFFYDVGFDGDYDDFVGRRGRRRRARRRARRRQRRAGRRGTGLAVRPPFQPTPMRAMTLPLGAVSIAVAPGPGTNTAGRLAVVMQRPAQFRRLSLAASDPTGTIDSAAARASILVTDVKLGTISQFVGIDSMPLDVFGAEATSAQIETGVARTGTTVSVDLENTNVAQAITVSGAMIGIAAD